MAELDGRRLWNYYGDYNPEDVDVDAFALIDNATTSTDNATTSTVPVHGEEDSIGSEDHFETGGTPMEVYWILTDEDKFPIMAWKVKDSENEEIRRLGVEIF